jgi:AcrR family transcriptional regulator
MAGRRRTTHVVSGARERKALTSPIRMEILGQFTAAGGMSIAEVAAQMGRSPGSLYYHFGILEKAGILKRVGSRRKGKRSEAVFEPVAPRIALAASGSRASGADARKALGTAFRMAERDFAAALESGTARSNGPHRNFCVTLMHCRLTPAVLAELNRHVKAIESLMERVTRQRRVPTDADQFVSLTLALLPLQGREVAAAPARD